MFGVEIAASLLLTGALPRATADRTDEVFGPQVHFVYALPADGVDRALDTSGAIDRSVKAFVGWLASEAGGPTLRVDTFSGELDVTFVRLEQTDAALAATGAFVVTNIEAELQRRGFLANPSHIYAVYYDGSSTYSCGGAFWPPQLNGRVIAMYLNGLAGRCIANPVGEGLNYWEFAMLHDIFHGLGAAPTCAPHHHLAGHVSDSPNDLMWAGDAPWQLPPKLDIGRDDYWGHGRSDCRDVSRSPYLTSTPFTRVVEYVVPRARAGRAFLVRLGIDVDGQAPPAGTTTCRARLGGRSLRARASFALGRGTCRWVLPQTAAGKRLAGAITLTTASGSVVREFSVRVRR